MGVRLKGEYYSTMGELFTWQLIDTGYGDLQHDTSLSAGGIEFNWQGNDRIKDTRFINCKATFSLMVDHINITNFIDDFKNANEGRFFLKVGNLSTPVMFIGKITSDGGEVEDNDYPYPFRLEAVDGLGNLSGINYSNTAAGEIPYTDSPTLLDHIFNCLDKIGTKDLYLGQDYLWIVCNYYEDQHPNATDNPLDKTRVSAKTYYTPSKESGTYDYKSCTDVLTDILINFTSTLFYVGPHYMLVQRSERATSSFRVFKYGTDRSLISSGNVSADVVISNAGGVNFRQGISSFGFLPGMRSAKITYNHGEQDVNLLYGITYSGDNLHPLSYSLINVGNVVIGATENIVLRFLGKLRLKSQGSDPSTSTRWLNHRYHFRLYLHTTYNSGAGNLWWEKKAISYDYFSPALGLPAFTYTAPVTYFDIITDIHNYDQNNINVFSYIGFDTNLLTTGYTHNIQFGFELVRVYDEKLAIVNSVGVNPFLCEWSFEDLSLVAIKDGNILERPEKSISEVTGDLNNSYSIAEETNIGDGPGKTSVGRLQVYNGTEWKDSATWKPIGGGTSTRLHILATTETLAGQKSSLLMVLGGFYSKNIRPYSRISYASKYFLMLSAKYATADDHWSGEWAEIVSPTRTGLVPWDKTQVTSEKVPIPINPGILPDDERKEDRVLGILIDDAIEKGVATTSIPLSSPADTDMFFEGDIINLIDPIHGHVHKSIKIAADVKKGDTSITIESITPTEYFPPGSYVRIDEQFENNNTYSETNEEYQYEVSFSGTELVCTHSLTNLSLESSTQIISKRHRVYKNGQKLIYGHAQGWSINNVGNKIVFAETCYSDSIEVYSYKVKKVYA